MISGFALINKVAGLTSFTALSRLKKAVGTKHVGHCGTLDPFAEGLLLALTGRMTKFFDYVTGMPKEYEAVMCLGKETRTLDPEGDIINTCDHIPSLDEILEKTSVYHGAMMQTPPAFSAVHVDGKRAYDLARRGREVQIPEREIFIYDFQILSYEAPFLKFRIRCSSGTYIRSIARDIAASCGSLGYLTALKRTAIGNFTIDSVEPDTFRILDPVEGIQKCGVKTMIIEDPYFSMLKDGKEFCGAFRAFVAKRLEEHSPRAVFDPAGNFGAMVEKREGRPYYIFAAGNLA